MMMLKIILLKNPGVVFVVSRDMFLCLIVGGLKMRVWPLDVVLCLAVVYVGVVSEGHVARGCPDKRIKVCDRYSHCEIACPCDYRGKKFISGAASVNRTLHSICGERKGVRLPIIPIKIYTPRGQKRVYALIDTGSEETLISKRLYTELDLKGVPLQVSSVTADGKLNLISSIDTNFKIGSIDNSSTRFEIDSTLVLDQMPSINWAKFPYCHKFGRFWERCWLRSK